MTATTADDNSTVGSIADSPYVSVRCLGLRSLATCRLTPATAAARQRGPASATSELLALVMRHWLAQIHTNSFEHVLAHLLADGFASLLLRFQKVRVAIGIDGHCF